MRVARPARVVRGKREKQGTAPSRRDGTPQAPLSLFHGASRGGGQNPRERGVLNRKSRSITSCLKDTIFLFMGFVDIFLKSSTRRDLLKWGFGFLPYRKSLVSKPATHETNG